MPLIVISAEQKAAGEAALDTDLRFLLSEKQIPVAVQQAFGHLGLTSIQIRRKAVERLTDGAHTITDALKSTYLDADIKGTHFTLQLVTGGKRDGAAASSSGEDGAAKKLRTELAAVRKELNALRNSTQQGGKGKRDSDDGKAHGWNDPPLRGGNPKGGKGAGGANAAARLRKLRQTEVLKSRTDGPNGKPICHFYQRGNCVKGSDCPYPHICLRCHKLGHTILDGTCKATPQLR